MRAVLANALRLSVYAAAAMPGGVHSPLALNLQAFATNPGARPMSRTRKAAVTAVFSYAQFAIAIVPGLVLVPLTLRSLGART